MRTAIAAVAGLSVELGRRGVVHVLGRDRGGDLAGDHEEQPNGRVG